jgi:hypothetical protein
MSDGPYLVVVTTWRPSEDNKDVFVKSGQVYSFRCNTEAIAIEVCEDIENDFHTAMYYVDKREVW